MKLSCIKAELVISLFLLFISASCATRDEQSDSTVNEVREYKLWYQQPAEKWVAALPVGNGRMGAMVFGKVYCERIQLNEESVWAGRRFDTNNPNAKKNLSKIRSLIFAGKIKEAYLAGNRYLLSVPPRFRSYQTLGDLFIRLDSTAMFSDYRRELILNNGIARTTFKLNGVTFSREVLVSAPDNVIAVRFSADRPGKISGKVILSREKDAVVRSVGNNVLLMNGQIVDPPDGKKGPGGAHLKFTAKLMVLNRGGEVSAEKDNIVLQNSDEVMLLLTAATDYNLKKMNFDRTIDPAAVCEKILTAAKRKSWREIKDAHIREHQALFNRVEIDLGGKGAANLPTDRRLQAVVDGKEDNDLIALYFQYGRYLLMNSSRAPGILPANLQGVWNEHFDAPWNSDYHTNINLQMNYWPAEVCNLPETIAPLTNLVNKWREPGRLTAREMYNCSGWCMHHASDIYGKTAPIADMRWGMSPLSGVWMTFPLWRHYEFTLDKTYLQNRAYPIMKEAAEFIADFLVEKDGYLITCPTMSPENSYYLPGKKEPCQLTYAATIDNQILTAHLNHCIAAGKILGVDKNERQKWQEMLLKIPPIKVGKDSTIMEWIKDYKEVEPGHRHMSHLLALYPLSLISPKTPELYAAAKKTIARRLKHGGGHTGWSRAWIISFFARLQNAEKAYENVRALLRKSTLSNLFDNHPPFQIDGNFGGTAGIAEMLLQSHNGAIRLLPALPPAWKNGEINGLCARGDFEVGMKWANGKLTEARILAKTGNLCKVQYDGKIKTIKLNKGEIVLLNGELESF